MANTLQDMYHFDSAEYDKNISQSFADKATNYQNILEAGRKNMLAEAQIPSQLSGYKLAEADTEGKLAALPQQLDIAKTERNNQEEFQRLRKMRAAIVELDGDEPSRQYVLTELMKRQLPTPNGLGDIGKPSFGQDATMRQDHFMRKIQRRDYNSLLADIDHKLESLSKTMPGVEKLQGEIIQKQLENEGKGLNPLVPPSSGSGGSGSAKEAESVRKYIEDQRKVAYGNANLQKALKDLGFVFDTLNGLQRDKDKAPSEVHFKMAEKLIAETEKDFANRTASARKKYYQLLGLDPDIYSGAQPAQQKPAEKEVEFVRGADGKLIRK